MHDSSNELQKEKLEAVPVGTWWDWVSIGRYWFINDGTGPEEGGTVWCLVALGQYVAVLVDI